MAQVYQPDENNRLKKLCVGPGVTQAFDASIPLRRACKGLQSVENGWNLWKHIATALA